MSGDALEIEWLAQALIKAAEAVGLEIPIIE